MSRVDPIARALERAVEDGVFPGAVLLVRHRGAVVCHTAAGRLGTQSLTNPAHRETVYDLASLTKPLATATLIALLVQDLKLGLAQRVEEFLPDLHGTGIGEATISTLLQHRSGLPAWRPYYQSLSPSGQGPGDRSEIESRKQAVMAMIAQEPLELEQTRKSVYSDLGYLLLGFIIERYAGASLATLCRERIFSPLHIAHLCYVNFRGEPEGGEVNPDDVAPTEQDAWRGRLVRGIVHDENAYALGGIAGHAGLFGTASDVGLVGEQWLACFAGRLSILQQRVVEEFVALPDHSPESSWVLGWDTPSPPSSSGARFSPRSFGHLGYAGTSIWIDPTEDLLVVLLSNRVHPTRENKKIQAFRPAIHDLVFEEVVGRGG